MIWLSLAKLLVVLIYIHMRMLSVLKMLVVGSLVSKCLYMLTTCLGGFVILNSWLDGLF
jgi:hypothetical protein